MVPSPSLKFYLSINKISELRRDNQQLNREMKILKLKYETAKKVFYKIRTFLTSATIPIVSFVILILRPRNISLPRKTIAAYQL